LRLSLEQVPVFLSGLAFIFYGIDCISSEKMSTEFKRFGIARFRLLTGLLEILGGLGQLIGLQWRGILVFSSIGLSILMLLGVLTRVRVGDPFQKMIPAFLLLGLNVWISLFHAYSVLGRHS
jgi:uncharacterized membrane protein YphA (DoxX/SURF4 family)